MKANELRVGNFIHSYGYDFNEGGKFIDKDNQEIVKCRPIDIGCVYEDPCVYDFIELNDYWLKRLGFVFNSEYMDYYFKNTKYYIHKINESYFLYMKCYQLEDPEIINLKYVHQVQNIYFFLTGEEL